MYLSNVSFPFLFPYSWMWVNLVTKWLACWQAWLVLIHKMVAISAHWNATWNPRNAICQRNHVPKVPTFQGLKVGWDTFKELLLSMRISKGGVRRRPSSFLKRPGAHNISVVPTLELNERLLVGWNSPLKDASTIVIIPIKNNLFCPPSSYHPNYTYSLS